MLNDLNHIKTHIVRVSLKETYRTLMCLVVRFNVFVSSQHRTSHCYHFKPKAELFTTSLSFLSHFSFSSLGFSVSFIHEHPLLLSLKHLTKNDFWVILY